MADRYSVRNNLVLQFKRDTIDQSPQLAETLFNRFGRDGELEFSRQVKFLRQRRGGVCACMYACVWCEYAKVVPRVFSFVYKGMFTLHVAPTLPFGFVVFDAWHTKEVRVSPIMGPQECPRCLLSAVLFLSFACVSFLFTCLPACLPPYSVLCPPFFLFSPSPSISLFVLIIVLPHCLSPPPYVAPAVVDTHRPPTPPA